MYDTLYSGLKNLKSYVAGNFVLAADSLVGLQTVDVLSAIYRKRAIISYDTGLGKTYLASGIIRMLLNEDSSRKFIIIVKNKQLEQTPVKLQRCIGVSVMALNAERTVVKEKILSGDFLKATVLVITHSCLQNNAVMSKLLENKQEYCCLIIDEAHNLSNTTDANSAVMLRGMCRAFEYCFALTATPITSDVKQYASLASMLDNEKYPDSAKLARNLRSGKFRIMDDPLFFIERKRNDFGISSKISGFPYFVECMPHQFGARGQDMAELCKGDGAVNQAMALVSFIEEHKGSRGLIYVNRHSIRGWIIPFLEKAGIRYGCINGCTKRSEDRETMQRFNKDRELDVVITSITEAIDLDCDWVMFYELTLNVEQMIGRAYRGLNDKELNVYFMLTKDTYESDFFYENIYKRSQMVKNILGKECTAVLETQGKIEHHWQ